MNSKTKEKYCKQAGHATKLFPPKHAVLKCFIKSFTLSTVVKIILPKP